MYCTWTPQAVIVDVIVVYSWSKNWATVNKISKMIVYYNTNH